MVGYLATTTVEVKVIPSIYEFITLRAEAEMFEGLPVITLQGSPLQGEFGHETTHRCYGATAALLASSPFFFSSEC